MIETDRLIAPQAETPREDVMDRAIRPKTLDEYVGQKVVREQMSIFLQAAKQRDEPLDHTLIFGPPGLGKTTLASLIALYLGVSL
jgi:Holliday junction DNA helicase RuvB